MIFIIVIIIIIITELLWELLPLSPNRLVCSTLGSLVAQIVKNLPATQETQIRSLGQKDPLEKEMATHSSILAWEIPWTEEPGGLQSMGSQRAGCNVATVHTQILVQSWWPEGS